MPQSSPRSSEPILVHVNFQLHHIPTGTVFNQNVFRIKQILIYDLFCRNFVDRTLRALYRILVSLSLLHAFSPCVLKKVPRIHRLKAMIQLLIKQVLHTYLVSIASDTYNVYTQYTGSENLIKVHRFKAFIHTQSMRSPMSFR